MNSPVPSVVTNFGYARRFSCVEGDMMLFNRFSIGARHFHRLRESLCLGDEFFSIASKFFSFNNLLLIRVEVGVDHIFSFQNLKEFLTRSMPSICPMRGLRIFFGKPGK